MKIDADGVVEWESGSWETVRCASSDTSLRVMCDGKVLRGSANIGRFQQADNLRGLGVIECVERWAEVLRVLGFELQGFGSRWAVATLGEWGTYITRVDLCANYETSDYAALCRMALQQRINRKLPSAGKYGPTWGYDSKRANWWKAKLYDKSAELAGKRRSDGGATLARFEVQLGGELLKREGLDSVGKWGDDMGKVIFGRFAEQVFKEQASVEEWGDIPVRLRAYAILWRDGVDLRTVMSRASYYRTAAKLREYGVDVVVPCNVVALTQRCRVVEVRQVSALREVPEAA